MRAIALFAAASCLALPAVAEAQTGARNLGRNISAAVGAKANAVNRANRTARPSPARASGDSYPAQAERAQAIQQRRAARADSSGARSLPTGDALAGTDAPTCELENGSSLRVSGSFRPSGETNCGD